jgi:hypothetical protein
MREVLFKKFIDCVRESTGEFTSSCKEGTNAMEEDFVNSGIFHGWGVAYEELGSGAGNFSVALVEIIDGTMVEVLPIHLKFVELTKIDVLPSCNRVNNFSNRCVNCGVKAGSPCVLKNNF